MLVKLTLYEQIKNATCDLALFACTNCLTLKDYHQTMRIMSAMQHAQSNALYMLWYACKVSNDTALPTVTVIIGYFIAADEETIRITMLRRNLEYWLIVILVTITTMKGK